VSETLLLSTARKIVDWGLRDLGYNYIILDDCWATHRGSNGSIMPNMTRFPHGMAGVAKDLHSMGLKYGMYSSAGQVSLPKSGLELADMAADR
jgi:alpha-galactosidase